MNRRTFTQMMATAAVGAAAAPLASASNAAQGAESETTPFPLSVMLWTVFNDLPFEQRLAKVREAGYTNIELVGEYNKWAKDDYDRANAARKQLGIQFDATAGLHNPLVNPGARDGFLDELKQALGPMETLDCPAMIVLSGNVDPSLSREAQHASCVEGLKRAAAMIEGREIHGQPVRLLLECIDPEENPKYYLQTAAEGIDVVREVNHPQVRFLYDMFHEQIAEGNLIEKLDKHIDVISLIHVADVPGRHQPGTGEINYMNVYRKLAQLNYRGMVAMEFRPAGDPVETLRTARLEVAKATKA